MAHGSSQAVLEELSARAAAYPNPRNASLGLRVFTQDRVKPSAGAPDPAVWTDLAGLYGGPPGC